MKTLVLAAGRGTRMRELTLTLPKPLLKLNDKPLLEMVVTRLRDAGIHDFVIVINYLGEKIQNALRAGTHLGVRIKYLWQENRNGTGGAVKSAEKLMNRAPFLVTFGDVVISVDDYKKFLQTYQTEKPDVLLGVNWVDDPWYGAAVIVEKNNIVKEIIEKPPRGTIPSRWNNTGLFLFEPVIFEHLRQIKPSPRGEY